MCACALFLLRRTILAASLEVCLLWAAGHSAVLGCGLFCESPWIVEAWFHPSEKSTGGKDTWKISACTMACVCVHVSRWTTAALNIFSPILQEVPNFRPRVSCSISLQYVTSYPFALLIILMSLCFNRVPFIWELPYSTVSFCQNEINFNSPKTCWYNKVLRCRDKHAPCYWCQGMYCCTLNLFRDTDSEMTFKITAMTPCILCLVPTRVFSFKKFWNTGQKNLL